MTAPRSTTPRKVLGRLSLPERTYVADALRTETVGGVLLLAAAPAGALAASVTIERRTRKAPTTEAVAGAQLGKCPLQDSNLGPSD